MALGRRCDGGVTSSFRRQLASSDDMPLSSDVFRVPPGYNAPQQVHITQGDHDGTAMIISWVTENEPGSSKVLYGTSPDDLKFMAKGKHTTYTFFKYTSGYIHHCTIKNLKYDTKYYYAVGIGHTLRKFWFTTPPKVGPDVPYTFGLIDTTGLQYLPLPEYHLNLTVLASLGYEVCKAYTITYRVKLSHLSHTRIGIMFLISLLAVQLHFGIPSSEPQHTSLSWHHIRHMHRVSNIASNVINGICKPVIDQSAPVYITIGDGGNLKGLATNMMEPQPSMMELWSRDLGDEEPDARTLCLAQEPGRKCSGS